MLLAHYDTESSSFDIIIMVGKDGTCIGLIFVYSAGVERR